MKPDPEDFLVFDTYKSAEGHAFSKGIVSEDDKDRYFRVFEYLRDAVAGAIQRTTAPETLDVWNCRFARKGGVQGQRPVDLWASIINRDSDAFSKFPQIYVIASEKGVEVGFSVTIHEDDYFNSELKRKNRSIIPIINSKLPPSDSPVVGRIQAALTAEPGWKYGEKARQGPISSFVSFPQVIDHLKSGRGTPKGGGSVYRIFDFEDIAASDDKLENELVHALDLFRPIMQMLQPTSDEAQQAENLITLAEFAELIPTFDPADEGDGKQRILREIAVRQGQAKFRDDLIQAYAGTCAISGCSLAPTLQAAHISPWSGTKSNHVSNGILLRADIHTLFDLGLIQIDPDARTVLIAASIANSEYGQYAGRAINEPEKQHHRASQAALIKKLEMFPAA